MGLFGVAPQVAPAIARLPMNLRVSCRLYLAHVPATARVGCHAPRLPLIPFVDGQPAPESCQSDDGLQGDAGHSPAHVDGARAGHWRAGHGVSGTGGGALARLSLLRIGVSSGPSDAKSYRDGIPPS